jgi:DNA-binding HxlR family transcriptional regulator
MPGTPKFHMNESYEHTAFGRSPCPVTNVLDLFGDKWTLLVVRDLLLGKTRYDEFAQSPEGIPTNILADRLKKLERAGVVKRKVYCEKPVRYEYELTGKGRDLLPILEAMADWGMKHVPGSTMLPSWQRPS